jgi:hypothetical protein
MAYDSLNTQIELFKTKVSALSGSTLNAQDLVFLAKAIESMGNLLGVNDVLAVTAEKVNEIQNASSGAVTQIGNAGSVQIAAVATSAATASANLQSTIDTFRIYSEMGVI